MRRLTLPFVSAILALSAAVAFAEPGVDVNDVSVLFPLSENLAPFPEVRLDEGKILTPELLRSVLDHATQLGIKFPPRSANNRQQGAWHVLGFRYDPCASDSVPSLPSPCLQELRLIAQPMGETGPEDTALHLIYRLNEGDLQNADTVLNELFVTKLQAEGLTKSTSSGLPLQVQPILVDAMKKKLPVVGSLYKDFLLRNAIADKLRKITMMGLRDAQITDWIFFGGNVNSGRWSIDRIPNLPAGSDLFVELNKATPTAAFSPLPIDPELSMAIYFNKRSPTQDELKQTHTNIERIESLDLANRNNVDCLSCHSTTTLRVTPRLARFLDLSELGLNVPNGITAYPAPRVLQNHMFHWNLRAFGYFGTLPAMNLRSVAESGRAAEAVNKVLKRQNPGLDCAAQSKEVMTCLIKSSTPFSQETAGADCLKLCQKIVAPIRNP